MHIKFCDLIFEGVVMDILKSFLKLLPTLIVLCLLEGFNIFINEHLAFKIYGYGRVVFFIVTITVRKELYCLKIQNLNDPFFGF